MEKIFSKGRLFHMIFRKEDFEEDVRVNIIDSDQFIQCAALNLPQGTTFKPHRHKFNEGTYKKIAQEAWVVLSGSVKVSFYGDDNLILKEVVLNPGDASFTFEGGHNYVILEPGTLVYEFKTGPYYGQEQDKVFL